MKKPFVQELLLPILSLLLICLVSAGLLGAVNAVTAERIAQNAGAAVLNAQQTLLPGASTYREDSLDGTAYFTALDETGAVTGYIFTTAANGYGGTIKLMTGVSTAGVVTGVSVLEISETPALGMKAKENAFLAQFTGVDGTVSYTKDNNGSGNTVNAITSATTTTDAFTSAVNKALALYTAVGEVEQNG